MKLNNIKHINDINDSEFNQLSKQGQLIDVRTQEEYISGHIENAILHPVETIKTFNMDKNKMYYIYCKSSNRSKQACNYLESLNYDVINLDGGYMAYKAKSSKYSTNRKQLEVTVSDFGVANDIKSWKKQTGHMFIANLVLEAQLLLVY